MRIVLKDGTVLPDLPDGCFDGTPYGMVVKVIEDGTTLYVFGAGSSAGFVVPAAIENSEYDMLRSLGESISYVHAPGQIDGWEDNGTNGMNDPLIDGVLEVAWSNYDLLKATAKNDDGSYTIGTEIARKSDENYRVTGGYMTSIANEARRLGGKTGGMLPAVMEETLRGVTAGGGNVSDAHWLETAWGQDEFSYEIPFPISLTADMTTWLKNAPARSAYKSIVYDAATDTNTCSVYGVGGSEAIAFHKELKAGVKYTVSFDYSTSTGTNGVYADVYAPFIAFIPDDLLDQGELLGKDLFGRDAYAYTALSNSVTQDYATYTCEYTPGKNMDVYIAFISGCVADGVLWNFKMKNIKVTEG